MTRNNFIIGLILNLSVYANSCSISSGEEEVAPGTAQMGYMYLHQDDVQKQPIPQESKDQLDDQKAYDQLPEIYKDAIDETFGGIIGLRSVYNKSNSNYMMGNIDESFIKNIYDMYGTNAVKNYADTGNPMAQWLMYKGTLLSTVNQNNIQNIQKIKFIAYIWLSLSINSHFALAENDAQYCNYIGNDSKSLSQILGCSYNQAIRW